MIDVTNVSKIRFDVEFIYKAVSETVKAHHLEDYEVSVLLTDDLHITELNREYRGIDSPTDVLAFAMREVEDNAVFQSSVLGDIVISLDTAERQAINSKHSLETEVTLLTVHGVLHLLGYDHQTEEEAAIMFTKQDTVMQCL